MGHLYNLLTPALTSLPRRAPPRQTYPRSISKSLHPLQDLPREPVQLTSPAQSNLWLSAHGATVAIIMELGGQSAWNAHAPASSAAAPGAGTAEERHNARRCGTNHLPPRFYRTAPRKHTRQPIQWSLIAHPVAIVICSQCTALVTTVELGTVTVCQTKTDSACMRVRERRTAPSSYITSSPFCVCLPVASLLCLWKV